MMNEEEQTYNCVFCKESFDDKETLQTHFRKHADPNFNRPEKVKKLQDQSETAQDKSGAKVELVSCDVCPEVFPTISKAITHKHKMHPDHDAKYFCDWCGKLFTMKHLYNKHLVSHEPMEKISDEVFHCDSCNVDFNVPSAMIYHNKFFHRQDTELPAIGHSRKQTLVHQELIAIYYCAFCGEEYINKVNLHKHMADDHGDENQSPDEVLRCPLCDAIFYHLDAYEAHLTTHSCDDIYSGKNMITEDLNEFTLDSVPPVLEKVENVEPEDAATMDLNQLLQLSGTNDDNNDSNSERRKHKKHKKHKKSKKEKSITLDEFLNMNTDVFGEGLDFQGIEEVPTRVVTKRLKRVKPPTSTGSKMVSKSDLDKLKQLGIAVKMKKTNKVPVYPGVKIAPGTKVPSTNPVKIANSANTSTGSQLKSGIQETTIKNTQSNEDVLMKLMSGQNQIKIARKPAQETNKVSQELVKENLIKKPVPSNKSLLGALRSDTPENIEVDCDLLLKGSSETERESSEVEPEELAQLNGNPEAEAKDKPNSPELNLNGPVPKNLNCEIDTGNTIETTKVKDNTQVDRTQTHKSKDVNTIKSNETTKHEDKDVEENNTGSLNIFKNISQHITIKPIRQTKEQSLFVNTNTDKAKSEIPNAESVKCNEDNENIQSNLTNKNDGNNSYMSPVLRKIQQSSVQSTLSEKQFNSQKNSSQNVTIKSAGTSSSRERNSDTKEDEYGSEEESMDREQNKSNNISQNPPTSYQSNVTENKAAKSLDALKHLGIVVKSTVQTSNNSDIKTVNNEKKEEDNSKNIRCQVTPKENQVGKSVDALKSLGITIKPTKKANDIVNKFPDKKEEFNTDDIDVNKSEEIRSSNDNFLINRQVNTIVKQQRNFQQTSQSMTKSFNVQKNLQKAYVKQFAAHSTSNVVEQSHETDEDNDFTDDDERQQHAHEHKPNSIAHLIQSKSILDNLTIKPKSALQNISKEITVKTPSHSPKSENQNSYEDKQLKNKNTTSNSAQSPGNVPLKPACALKNLSQQITIKSINPVNKTAKTDCNNAPEIFSIDDSDSEGDQNSLKRTEQSNIIKVEQNNVVAPKVQSSPNINALKSFRKNVINKPVPQNAQQNHKHTNKPVTEEVGIKEEYDDHQSEDNDDEHNSKDTSHTQIVSPSIAKLMNNKNINIKNMQCVNQVKSSIMKSPQIHNKMISSQNAQMNASFDGFFSNESSDEGNESDNINMKGSGKELVLKNIKESNSDHEEFDNFDEDKEHLANEVIHKLQNFNQNLSIKSSNANVNTMNKTVKSMQETKDSVMKTQARVMKRDVSQLEAEDSTNHTKIMKKQFLERPVNQSKQQQQMSAMNTLNQEVTTSVKTIQTKTIVQEITTTVTRTIKTVNQEVVTSNKQMISNSTQPANIIRPKIVQGMRPHIQQGKNFQGVAVRHATPVIRPQFRPMTPGTPVRTAKNTAIRSIRPSGTVVRPAKPSGPRMPTKIMPAQNNPRTSPMGKPVKIAQNVKTQPVKIRNAVESEPEGHFSCFKKPKESLIPELPFMAGESSMHVASTSQMTNNFSSSMKTVNKSNNVVIASQMKSEMHSSSQQMSRTSNASGITMTKSSQSRQAVKEVQKCEVSATKRSTLDAIERLQKQGLLVKKPRIEEPDEWEHSGSDDGGDHDTGPLAIGGG